MRPSDTTWWHLAGSGNGLCCLIAPSHYLNQCCLIISEVQWQSSEANFTRNTSAISHQNQLQNYLDIRSYSNLPGVNVLTHWGRDEMDAIMQTTFSRAFFLKENVWILTKISLKFVPKGPIYNIPALVQIMAWRCPGDKPLSESMMDSLPTHICVTQPQCVKQPLTGWVREVEVPGVPLQAMGLPYQSQQALWYRSQPAQCAHGYDHNDNLNEEQWFHCFHQETKAPCY